MAVNENHLVKRAGSTQKYESRKLYASIYAACLCVMEPEGSAELIAAQVANDVEHWLGHKHEVTSNDIRRQAGAALKIYQPEAAYMYMHHRVIH